MKSVLGGIGLIAGLLSFGCEAAYEDFPVEFDTAVEVEETVLRANSWCIRNGFDVQGRTARELTAEKRRPLASGSGQQIDILVVKFKRDSSLTHVTIRALTDLDDEHGRRRAGQVSNEARAAAQALARELMASGPGG